MEQNKAKIRAYILSFIEGYDLKDDEDIFAISKISSLFAMQLVLFVEKEFKIRLGKEDLAIKNFSSVNNVAQLVTNKQEALVDSSPAKLAT